jgi:DNA-binding transcriptional regulator YhcF (GntR family)
VSPLPEGLAAGVDRASDLPLGAQLARSLRAWIAGAAPSTRLPSVRELAAVAGVNVNTVRAVYGRLESEGLVRSEQGRGTFVTPSRPEAGDKAELRRQITLLEAELARRPPLGSDPFAPAPRQAARLMSADDLRQVRDELVARLRSLDEARAEVLELLAELEEEHAAPDPERAPEQRDRRSTVSIPGARVRWVGA